MEAETGGLSLDSTVSGPVQLTLTPPSGVSVPTFPASATLVNGQANITVTFPTAGYYRIEASGPNGSRFAYAALIDRELYLSPSWAEDDLAAEVPRGDGRPTSGKRATMTAVSDLSLWSEDSFLSIASRGSILSIGSAGSALSVGSAGSALSVASVGSTLSAFSAGSVLSVGSALSARSRWSLLSSGGDHDVLARRVPPLPALLLAGGAALAVLLTVSGRGS